MRATTERRSRRLDTPTKYRLCMNFLGKRGERGEAVRGVVKRGEAGGSGE